MKSKDLYMSVHKNFICNTQKLEKTQIHQQMNEQTGKSIQWNTTQQERQSVDIHSNLNESQSHCTE